MDEQPLVVFGERSVAYDFGPDHPLTPMRFGPGIDLLRELGATRFLEPKPATDGELTRLHDPAYVAAVRTVSRDPGPAPEYGISPWGDNPAFAGVHEAAATVAGGSLAAMARILDGTATRAFHPGGGLHHAMRARASGFCVYNDVALAIALARDAGHRVLYVDIDVHHGDGVEALFWDNPDVLTVSIHETGDALFPGTGFPAETGGPGAPGRAVNVPLEPGTGDPSWLAAVRAVVPALAHAFRPTVLVSQQGCDTHAWDPLAHLRVTTAAHAEAARLIAEVSSTYTGGRWLATGGGGYDAFRVVPRTWAIIWLTLAGRPIPDDVPEAWRTRWEEAARRSGMAPLPERFADDPSIAAPERPETAERNARTVARVLRAALDRLAERGRHGDGGRPGRGGRPAR
jgi:acetoin utilization protein AcuC